MRCTHATDHTIFVSGTGYDLLGRQASVLQFPLEPVDFGLWNVNFERHNLRISHIIRFCWIWSAISLRNQYLFEEDSGPENSVYLICFRKHAQVAGDIMSEVNVLGQPSS